MGLRGLEPPTLRLSGVRSNHLSYKPMLFRRRISFLPSPLVEMRRIELLTPCLQGRCSPIWATPPYLQGLEYLSSQFPLLQGSPFFKVCTLQIKQRFAKRTRLTIGYEAIFQTSGLLRKEVIQPHLPIRLPCYDFTLITSPTFGRVLLTVRLRTSGITGSHGVTGGVYKARERIHRGMLIRDY